jgi:predicted  nucleic acid-binding Zn-ribbon protein
LAEQPTLTRFPWRKSQEENEGENCPSIVRFVNEIDMEGESLRMEADKLKTVTIQLEMKARDTANLIEALQSVISVKEKQMGSARKGLEAALALEDADVEQLKRQLSAREHEMEVLMQKFHNENLKIDREVESEWNRREEVMEMHFVGK